VCGTCHNPHTQETPAAAAGSCVDCHAAADTLTPFHRGLRAEVAENCVACHEAHTFRVEGDDCIACHTDDTGGAPISAQRLIPVHLTAFVQRQQQSPFDHADHRDLQCTECHSSNETHGEVTLKSPAQCVECHHTQSAAAGSDCAQCHSRNELNTAQLVERRILIKGASRRRQMPFDHDQHTEAACAECHTQGATLRVNRDCDSCHENHHRVTTTCTSCHVPATEAHEQVEVHTRSCAGSECHEAEGYGSMALGRNTCLTCHNDLADHRPGEVCADCHRMRFALSESRATVARR
jgi:hypothetical protein